MRIDFLLLLIAIHQSSCYVLPRMSHALRSILFSSPSVSEEGFSQEEIVNYMQGNKNAKWKGNRNILVRKKQIPAPSLLPNQVVQVVTSALQINDDPQLDHGCQVLLEFANPNGILRQSGLDASEYGRYLRSSDYHVLLENSDVRILGDVRYNEGRTRAVQRVEFIEDSFGNRQEGKSILLDFFLSKEGDLWLIDVILKATTNSAELNFD